MTWLLITGLIWAVLAVGLAVVVSRGIRLADAADRPAAWTSDVERYLRDQAPAPLC
ncbi:hypothetical protein [Blastococcus sp. TF02A-30]|uniref:hypothetical protein n=1 Tax=Blastococcus sp. TF02A-30 TaxID=2250580 RepID=UPI001314A06A|nr:hypothetical protein [Blastococcus sp. TF02A-30]